MNGADKEGDIILRDIIDKLNGFEISQKKTYIRTKPTSLYPRGKFYIGYVRFIDTTTGTFNFFDDKEAVVTIYFSEIAGPTDIEEARR